MYSPTLYPLYLTWRSQFPHYPGYGMPLVYPLATVVAPVHSGISYLPVYIYFVPPVYFFFV